MLIGNNEGLLAAFANLQAVLCVMADIMEL